MSNEMDDAMKKIGPAYMCGAPYEYGEALNALKASMRNAGVPDVLVDFSIDGLDRFNQKTNAQKRSTISAEECAKTYKKQRS